MVIANHYEAFKALADSEEIAAVERAGKFMKEMTSDKFDLCPER